MNNIDSFISTYGVVMKKAFHRAVEFHGRSDRSEFWYSLITVIVVSFFIPLLSFIGYLFLIPLGIRRLHDTGRSGWWLAISLITIPIQLFVLLLGVLSLFSFTYLDAYSFLLEEPFLWIGSTSVLYILVLIFRLLILAYHVLLVYFLCQESDPNPNRYGPPTGDDYQ